MSNIAEGRCDLCHRRWQDVFVEGPMIGLCTTCAWQLDTERLEREKAEEAVRASLEQEGGGS